MKIFNTENGVSKVYVQMNDIMMLNQVDEGIPASIYTKILTNDIIVVNDQNRMDFVEFTNPFEIEFFRSQDWIIDYKEVQKLTDEEIQAMGQEIIDEMNLLAKKYQALKEEDRKNSNLPQKYNLLDYKMKYLAEILLLRKGKSPMPFPVVPDSDGFSFVGDEDYPYEIRASLDPNKFLLFRKDGEKMNGSDKISPSFLQSGMAIALMENNNTGIFSGDYTMNYSLSEDQQYLIIEYHTESYKDKVDNRKKESTRKENKVKQLMKRIFQKK